MASRREEVLDAIKALVAGALPNADVKRNLDKPERVAPGGLVIIRDGDPGEPEVLLSPLTYVYEHRVPIEVAAFASASLTREQESVRQLGVAGVGADREDCSRRLRRRLSGDVSGGQGQSRGGDARHEHATRLRHSLADQGAAPSARLGCAGIVRHATQTGRAPNET